MRPNRPGGWRVSALLGMCLLGLPSVALGQVESTVESTSYAVDGLELPAEILVDRWGVPHLYAETFDDLFFVQGWNAARDRLWQLDLWKRRGDGTLADALGPDYVDQDRAARLLLYRGDMYTEWLAYASDTKRIVTAFVSGINAYIDLVAQTPELLPLEFELLGYQPAKWSPETVVRIRGHGLRRNVGSEVSRARFVAEHGIEALWLRDHYQPHHRLEIPEGLDPGAIPEDVLETYRLGTGSVRFPATGAEEGGASQVAQTGLESRGREVWPELWAQGSNNWAVAPRRTATGRALLADDPHRSLSVPSLRYIAHLSGPGLDVIGAGEPALPGVSIGHNGRIAFGLTIFGIDQEDLYVYETHPEDPSLYRYRDRWEPMTVVRETISVRDAESVAVELLYTRHGPVIYEDRASSRAFALRAAWLDPGMAPYLGSIEYMRARSWDDFLAAMNRWGAPSENQVYADTDGNIGWKPGGRTPIRPNWDGLLPVPGDGRYEWSGYRDMDELPVEHNPDRGWVATANQMNLPPGFERPTGYEWAPGYRYRRIAEVLSATGALTVAASLDLQTDFLSLPARRLQRLLRSLRPASAVQRRALTLLGDWDARLEAESAAAVLFEIWWRRHLPGKVVEALVTSDATRQAIGSGHPQQLLAALEEPGERWGAEPRPARDRVLLSSLEQAVADVESLLGEEWSEWRWGDLHHAELRHPLSSRVDDDTRRQLDIGPLPRGGSGDTPGSTRYSASTFRQISGATFRMVVDVGSWDDSIAMSSPGQSGDPRSSHYRDLFGPWARNESFPLLYSRAAVERETVRKIVLLPLTDQRVD